MYVHKLHLKIFSSRKPYFLRRGNDQNASSCTNRLSSIAVALRLGYGLARLTTMLGFRESMMHDENYATDGTRCVYDDAIACLLKCTLSL